MLSETKHLASIMRSVATLRMTKKRAASLLLLVAEARFERTTFGL